LLEIDGQTVPSDPQEFTKMVREIKAKTPVDAVVLRKGKKTTVKGLSLPEEPELPPAGRGRRFGGQPGQAPLPGLPGAPVPPAGARPGLPRVPGNPPVPAKPAAPGFPVPAPAVPATPGIQAVPAPPGFPGGAGGGGLGGGAHTVITSIMRTNDRFTTRHQEGSLVITVTGSVSDGKGKVSEIHVQDGTETANYKSVDKVPERYRDKVKNLVEMSQKGQVKVEIRNPPEE
jgi:hypothetical protein